MCDGVAVRWKCASPSHAASEVVVGSLAVASVAALQRLDDAPPVAAFGGGGALASAREVRRAHTFPGFPTGLCWVAKKEEASRPTVDRGAACCVLSV